MPVIVKKVQNKYRVVDSDTGLLVKTQSGTPADGGGYNTFERARRQATAINLNTLRREGVDIPPPPGRKK